MPAHKVWEDDEHLAFLDINPINLGHTLVIPKEHVNSAFQMSDDDYSELFLAAKKLAKSVKQATGAERVGLMVEGFGVPHVHVHVVPLFGPGELNPDKAAKEEENDLKAMRETIKKMIKEQI